jgi:hypothetical protein
MKIIVSSNEKGELSITVPSQGARLASSVTKAGKTITSATPVPVDSFFRQWPVPNADVIWAETEDDLVERIRLKLGDCFLIDSSEIPQDRTYRAAWVATEGTVSIDLDKAKAIHRDGLRARRSLLFPALDVAWMKAIAAEDKVTAANIEQQRQKLRDVTENSRVAMAQSIEELKILSIGNLLSAESQ